MCSKLIGVATKLLPNFFIYYFSEVFANGNKICISAPLFRPSDLAQIFPSWLSTIPLQTDNPRPVPPCSLVVFVSRLSSLFNHSHLEAIVPRISLNSLPMFSANSVVIDLILVLDTSIRKMIDGQIDKWLIKFS